jgi:hypothetical protein
MNVSLHRPVLALAAAGAALTLGMLNPLDASAQATAKYRVTLESFHVTAETWDNMLRLDGCGDEVFGSTVVQQFNVSGALLYESHPRTRTMGDQNGFTNRVRAGTCGDYGGIKTDDTVTINEPPVFDGTLTQGQDFVEITPSLWEYDGGASPIDGWIAGARTTLSSIRPALNTLVGPGAAPILDWAQLGLDAAVKLKEAGVTGDAGDRPIGMTFNSATGQYEYKPMTVRLNYDTAAIAAATNSGRITLRAFADDPKLRGNYSLTLKVARVEPAPVPAPTPTDPGPVEEPVVSPLCRRKPWLCI